MWGVGREAGTLFTKADIVSWDVVLRAEAEFGISVQHGRWQDELRGHREQSHPSTQMCDREVFGGCVCAVRNFYFTSFLCVWLF